MELDEIIELVLREKPHLSREYLLEKIKEKLAESASYLTEDKAAILVAREEGVRLPVRVEEPRVKISHLAPNMRNVHVSGCVTRLYPAQEYKKPNGSSGRLVKAEISDETGSICLLIWGKKAESISLNLGDRIEITNGYTKRGAGGRVELHVSNKSEIAVHRGPNASYKRIGSISENDKLVNLKAYILPLSPLVKYGRGHYLRAKLVDSSGQINAVFWGRKAEELSGVEKGSLLEILSAKTTYREDEIQLTVDQNSAVRVLPEKLEISELVKLCARKISTLSPYMDNLVVYGKITSLQDRGNRLCVDLNDGSASVALVLKSGQKELAGGLREGDMVVVEGASTRRRPSGFLELRLSKYGNLTVNPPNLEIRETWTNIGDIRGGVRDICVRGEVVEKPKFLEVKSQDELIPVASFKIKDPTGEIRVSFWREHAYLAQSLSAGDKIAIRKAYVKELFNSFEVRNSPHTEVETCKNNSEIEII